MDLASVDPVDSPNNAPRTRAKVVVVADVDKEEQQLRKVGHVASDDLSHTVSIIGATHSGKSFLINALSGGRAGRDGGVDGDNLREAADDSIAPTSSGAKYVLQSVTPPDDDPCAAGGSLLVRLVDYEGSHGGNTVPVDGPDATWAVRPGETNEQLMEARREAAQHQLPRVAFLTSDLLVYVTSLDPSDHRVVDDCAAFLARATVDAEREQPSLVIVFNKYNPKKLSKSLANGKTDEKFAQEFLEVHDNDGAMRSLFLEVKCLRISELDEDDEDEDDYARLFSGR